MPFAALFATVVLLGIADSMVNSYIVLFGADVAGLTPFRIGVWSSVFAGGLALPLFVTRALHQQPASVGVLFSVCAAVEVVATLGLAVAPARVSQRALILGGFGSLVCYHALTVLSSGMLMLAIVQAFRGVGIAIVAGAGIRYFQDLLAPATGRATTLFANASTAGLLLSGILTGAAVEHFGYRTTLLLCAVAAALGGVAFTLGSGRQAVGRQAGGRRHAETVEAVAGNAGD